MKESTRLLADSCWLSEHTRGRNGEAGTSSSASFAPRQPLLCPLAPAPRPSPTARALPPQQRRCRGTCLRCSELWQHSQAPAERKGEGIPPGGPGQFADGGGRKPDCQSLSSGPRSGGALAPFLLTSFPIELHAVLLPLQPPPASTEEDGLLAFFC